MFPALRSGKSAVKTKPKKIIAYVTARPPAEVMEIVQRFAQDNRYQVDDIDAAKGRIILSDAANRNSWGFFYPIYVSSQEGGGTLVEVGIQSRLVQMGRVVKSNHEKCAKGIEAALE